MKQKPKLLATMVTTTTDEVRSNISLTNPSHAPLGFGSLNLKVLQHPTEQDIKSVTQDERTKYVIVQTAPTSGESRVQKLSTDTTLGKCAYQCGETRSVPPRGITSFFGSILDF